MMSPAPTTRDAPRRRHHPLTIGWHWSVVVLVGLEAGSGLVLRDLTFRTPAYDAWHYWHRSFGTVAVLVVAAGLIWRRVRPTIPAAPDAAWRLAVAAAAQRLLLALLVLVPAAKLARGAVGLGWVLFGLSIPAPFASHAATGLALTLAHRYGAWLLLATAGVHAAAALWHHYVARDDVLRRMLPGRG